MNEPKSNKVGINDIKELHEEKINDHALHVHYRPSGVGAQQTKDTKGTHHGGFLPVSAGCDCVPAAPAVVILLTGRGLVDLDAMADGV
jgi:hypothetical protein